MKRIAPIGLVLALGVTFVAQAQVSSPAITAEELKEHVKYLASDELEGRAAGSRGNEKAASYVAELMQDYELEPAGDDGDYLQEFDFVSAVKLGDDNAVSFMGTSVPDGRLDLRISDDYRPHSSSPATTVSGPLIFAGYGISAPEKGYDDYASADVAGKIVVVLRYSPDGSDPHGELDRFSGIPTKVRVAREKGAQALIIVAGPLDDAEDALIPLRFDKTFPAAGMPVVSLKRSIFESFIRPLGKDLKTIQDTIKAARTPVVFDIPDVTARIQTEIVQVISRTANVVGILRGNDPSLKEQAIVIGAHLDHIGYGGPGSGSTQPDTIAIHNGADDNASGTAGLLELAQAFSSRKAQLKRTLLFIAFSAEENGTLGSSHYVNGPTVPLDRTIAMMNLDMVGRLQRKQLNVHGTGTSPLWSDLVTKYNADSTFSLRLFPDGFGPSDHSQFYAKNIPVLFFTTDVHSDYHKPSDDWDRLNYEGEERVIRYVYNIVNDVEKRADRPVFAQTTPTSPMGGGDSRGFSVTLGIIPDYGGTGEGLKISGVRPNGPAAKAGLQTGDIIVKMAGKKVVNIYDYTRLLGDLKAGDEVEVEVLREGKTIKLVAKMERRK